MCKKLSLLLSTATKILSCVKLHESGQKKKLDSLAQIVSHVNLPRVTVTRRLESTKHSACEQQYIKRAVTDDIIQVLF